MFQSLKKIALNLLLFIQTYLEKTKFSVAGCINCHFAELWNEVSVNKSSSKPLSSRVITDSANTFEWYWMSLIMLACGMDTAPFFSKDSTHFCVRQVPWEASACNYCVICLWVFTQNTRNPKNIKTLEKSCLKCPDFSEDLTAVGIHCSGMEIPNAKCSAAAKLGGILSACRQLAWVLSHHCLLPRLRGGFVALCSCFRAQSSSYTNCSYPSLF